MQRQTKNHDGSNGNAGMIFALLAAAALVAGACGGLAPDSQGPPGQSLDYPPPGKVVIDVDPMHTPWKMDTTPVDRIDPAALVPLDREDTGDLLEQQPEYKHKQVLELCNGGAMTVRAERVQQMLGGTFTLELWLRARDAADQRIVKADGLMIAVRNQRIVANIGGQELVGLNVVSDEWYHVALVVAGQQLQLYVNGIPLATQDALEADWQRPHGALVFGGVSGESHAFCGKLDSVRLTGERLYATHFIPQTELPALDAAAFLYSFDDQKCAAVVHDAGYWGVKARMTGEAALAPGAV